MEKEKTTSGKKADDLEITSIGALYRGPWDKKYWSSSRGRDRYPFPVGYCAVRTNAGSTYRMEVHQGSKGPIFMVTSTDGVSCSGQTPDIAWENFQRKSGPRVKNWQGKRLSSKIDGVELFGFRNPSVQRLLRELVANVGCIAERSSLSSNLHNESVQQEQEIQVQDSQACSNLLPLLEKKQCTGKRSMKIGTSIRSISKGGIMKSSHSQDLICQEGGMSEQVGDVSVHNECNTVMQYRDKNTLKRDSLAIQDSHEHQSVAQKRRGTSSNSEILSPTTTGFQINKEGDNLGPPWENYEGNKEPEMLSLPPEVSTLANRTKNSHTRVNLSMELGNGDYSVDKHVIFFRQSKLKDQGDVRVTCMEHEPTPEDKILQHFWSSDAQGENVDPSAVSKDNDTEITALARESEVCFPNIHGILEESQEKGPFDMKGESLAAKPPLATSASCAVDVRLKPLLEENNSSSQQFTSGHICATSGEVPRPVTHITDADNLSRGFVNDSLPEVGSSSGSSNASLEKTDLDSAGQELAKSMMTFLLPRALPLLKKTYERRRQRHRTQGTGHKPCTSSAAPSSRGQTVDAGAKTGSTCQDKLAVDIPVQHLENGLQEMVKSQQTFLGIDSLCVGFKIGSPLNGMIKDPFTDISCSKNKSVIPDSFEDEQLVHNVVSKRLLPSGSVETHEMLSGEQKKHAASPQSHYSEESMEKCHLRNDESNEAAMLLNKLENCEIAVPDSSTKDHPDTSFYLEEKIKAKPIHCDETIVHPVTTPVITNVIDNTCDLGPASMVHGSSRPFTGDTLYKLESQNLKSEYLEGRFTTRSNAAECHEQGHSACYHNNDNLVDDSISEASLTPDEFIAGYPEKRCRISGPCDLVNSDRSASVAFMDAGVRNRVDGIENPLAGPVATKNEYSSGNSKPEAAHSNVGVLSDSDMEGKLPRFPSYIVCGVPLSESIICRDFNQTDVPQTYFDSMTVIVENSQYRSTTNDLNRASVLKKEMFGKQPNALSLVENITPSDGTTEVAAPNQEIINNDAENMTSSQFISPFFPCLERNVLHDDAYELDVPTGCHLSVPEFLNERKHSCDEAKNHIEDVLACMENQSSKTSDDPNNYTRFSNVQLHQGTHLDGSLAERYFIKLSGCYLHPTSILSIFLTSQENHLKIGVVCGLLEGHDRNLFLYMIPVEEQGSSPSFLGYTSLLFPITRKSLNELPAERSGIQFTPDGRSLVFLNSIKAPHCREQMINCLCSNCKPDCSDENTVEVVHLKYGYVSSMVKLVAMEKITCMLVREPNYLVVAGESGRLHIWIMNQTWSSSMDEFKLPDFDCLSPTVLELKNISSSSSLIIGHNGTGSFGLWDISKRVPLARFSSVGNTIFHMLPVGLLSWQQIHILLKSPEKEKHIKEALGDNVSLSKADENICPSLSEGDAAVWLLISAASDSGAQDNDKMRGKRGSDGCWRLALLAKDVAFMGHTFPDRVSAVDASADYGIIGTCDGLVYTWEFSSGRKLINLHSFKCGVSCVKVDAKSGILAVASNEGELRVYLQSRMRNYDADE